MFTIFLHAFFSNDCNVNHCFMLRIMIFDANVLIPRLHFCREININDHYFLCLLFSLSFLLFLLQWVLQIPKCQVKFTTSMRIVSSCRGMRAEELSFSALHLCADWNHTEVSGNQQQVRILSMVCFHGFQASLLEKERKHGPGKSFQVNDFVILNPWPMRFQFSTVYAPLKWPGDSKVQFLPSPGAGAWGISCIIMSQVE